MPVRHRRIPERAIRAHLPDTRQGTDTTCGASSLQAVLHYFGVGPVPEDDVIRAMGMDVADGADPIHIVRGAKHYGLSVHEERPMSISSLRRLVDRGFPVMVMLQAWAYRRSYAGIWNAGHWVVAVGWDAHGVYFEEPYMKGTRGFLTYTDLKNRWHDIEGAAETRVPRYGVALWKPGAKLVTQHVPDADRIP